MLVILTTKLGLSLSCDFFKCWPDSKPFTSLSPYMAREGGSAVCRQHGGVPLGELGRPSGRQLERAV